VVGVVLFGLPAICYVQAPSAFGARIAQLSERAGFFDTDNLISNEKSYLHVMPALKSGQVTGGAYIGVGPDKNFSYIAQVRPDIAFIVDIRHDNLLLHLLFKALFSMSDTRVSYMSLLFGRPVPEHLEEWRKADLDALVKYLDDAQTTDAKITALRARVDATIRTFGVTLSAADFKTIDRFHRTFIDAGLPLQFQSTGRAPRGYYPTYRQLLLETDREGQRRNFLASEDDFQFVRSLERRDLVIPVVGDLGGTTALANIARLLTARHETVSAFYVSNVEYYLFGDGKIQGFVDNLSRLPHTDHSVLIRSVFGGYVLPQTVSGYYSTSMLQPIDDLLQGFANGRYKSYNDYMLTR